MLDVEFFVVDEFLCFFGFCFEIFCLDIECVCIVLV